MLETELLLILFLMVGISILILWNSWLSMLIVRGYAQIRDTVPPPMLEALLKNGAVLIEPFADDLDEYVARSKNEIDDALMKVVKDELAKFKADLEIRLKQENEQG